MTHRSDSTPDNCGPTPNPNFIPEARLKWKAPPLSRGRRSRQVYRAPPGPAGKPARASSVAVAVARPPCPVESPKPPAPKAPPPSADDLGVTERIAAWICWSLAVIILLAFVWCVVEAPMIR